MVVPTPSEKSTIYKCVCRFSGTKDVKTRKDGEDDYWTCPGCGSEYGPVQPYPGPVLATEPETPLSEATDCGEVSPVLEAFRESNDAAWKRYGVFLEMRRKMPEDEAYAYASRLPIRSDPSPELRERLETIAGYHDPHDSEGTQWCRACGTCFPCVTRVELDAVLAALGEKK